MNIFKSKSNVGIINVNKVICYIHIIFLIYYRTDPVSVFYSQQSLSLSVQASNDANVW